MSGDVVVGPDGRARCAWAGAGDTASTRYHDEVWGTRTYDEPAMFEALTLGVFETGLSWSIVFGKRNAFREAFHGFDVAEVAAMTDQERRPAAPEPRDHPESRQGQGHRRQRAGDDVGVAQPPGARKVLRENAQGRAAIHRRHPSSTPASEALAKQLKAQGYRFVGPTSVYAFMQNVGMVNDHVRGCFRAAGQGQSPA